MIYIQLQKNIGELEVKLVKEKVKNQYQKR